MNTTKPRSEDRSWDCPLLGKRIEEGLCIDINYQRLRLVKEDVLAEVKRTIKKTNDEISRVCEGCPNLPLQDQKK
jgi:hypothetical protein